MEIDAKNKEILKLLMGNGRLSTSDIARHLGLSETGVRYRIDKLEEGGVIKRYTIGVDLKKLGLDVQVILGVKSAPDKLEECLKLLGSQPETVYLTRTTGEYDAVGVAGFSSINHLSSFLKKIYSTTGLSNCTVMHILDETKEFGPVIE